MYFRYAVYIFSSFFIIASILAVMGFDRAFRDKPWPTDISSNILIIILAIFFMFLVKNRDGEENKEA